jgi:probable rRNA maturation factor
MNIVFINRVSSTARIPRKVILRVAKRALKRFQSNMHGKSVGVVFVSISESKKLNTTYRSKYRATNVLSFESCEQGELGDVIICPSIARKEAKELKIGFNEHILYLFVHGLLHLLGYDHKTLKQETIMEKLTQKII